MGGLESWCRPGFNSKSVKHSFLLQVDKKLLSSSTLWTTVTKIIKKIIVSIYKNWL